MNIGRESGNDKQTTYFPFLMTMVFIIKTRHKSVYCDKGKIKQKKLSKLFSCDYLNTHFSRVKCRRSVNFEEIDTETSTGKNDGFDYCEDYLRSNQECKRRSRRKTDANFFCTQAVKCSWGFKKKESCGVHIIELVLHQKNIIN